MLAVLNTYYFMGSFFKLSTKRNKVGFWFSLWILALYAEHVHAENTLPSDQQEDVISVTATRLGTQDLQQAPISATFLDVADIESSNIDSVKGIETLVPNMSISENLGAAQVFIRGIGSNLVFIGSDPSVAIYLDGVYLGRPTMHFMEFLDLSHVEVLRGPQGTLYGRNATGGLIHVVSKEPDELPEKNIQFTMGNDHQHGLTMSINEPLTDNLYARAGLFYSRRDGYVDNALGGSELVDKNRAGIRTAFKYRVSEDFNILLRGDYLEVNETGGQYKPTLMNIDPHHENEVLIPVVEPVAIDDFYTINVPFSPYYDQKNSGVSGKASLYLGSNQTLTALSSYRQNHVAVGSDTDFTEIDSRLTKVEEKQSQVSQEIIYSISHDKWQWDIGLFYFLEHITSDIEVGLFAPGFSMYSTLDQVLKTKAHAVFSRGKWLLSDNVHLNLGIRYSDEKKEFKNRGSTEGERSKDWGMWTPKFGLDYQINERSLLYGSISRGFKSGGFNLTSSSDYDPETVFAYEGGIKTESENQLIQINASVFYYDYDDLQVAAFETTESSAPRLIISNAAKAEIKGAELEINAVLTEQWRMSSALSLLDARYKKFNTERTSQGRAMSSVNAKNNSLNVAPDKTVNLTIHHSMPIDYGSVTSSLSYYWQSRVFYTAFNDRITSQGAYNLWNAQIGWLSDDESLGLAIFGRNLTSEEYTNSTQDFSPLGVTQNIMPPRTFGIKMMYKTQ